MADSAGKKAGDLVQATGLTPDLTVKGLGPLGEAGDGDSTRLNLSLYHSSHIY